MHDNSLYFCLAFSEAPMINLQLIHGIIQPR